jgi:hypothetical protein
MNTLVKPVINSLVNPFRVEINPHHHCSCDNFKKPKREKPVIHCEEKVKVLKKGEPIEGPQGEPGDIGLPGEEGEQGEEGCVGPNGTSGIQGPPGVRM